MEGADLIGPGPFERPNYVSSRVELEYVMANHLMTNTQQRLEPGAALRVRPARHARRLVVTQGRLWLTGDGIEGDLWLRAGEVLELAPGVDLVAEGWPSARFELVEPAPRRVSAWRPFGAVKYPSCGR